MPYTIRFRLAFAFLVFFSRTTHAEFLCAAPPLGITAAAKPTADPVGFLEPHGQLNAMVVFAKFNGEAPANKVSPAFAADLFKPDRPGSLSHFYDTMSFGQLKMRGQVLARRYASDSTAQGYLATDSAQAGDYGCFVLEILRQVDRDTDLTQFDNDGPDGVPDSGDDDGVVDYIFVNTLSTPARFLLGPATGIVGLGFDQYTSKDIGRSGQPILVWGSVDRGVIQREGSFSQTVGSMAHEFGHSMGLPDLYDVSFLQKLDQPPADDAAGIGHWGLMGWGAHGWTGSDGPEPFSAWSLEQLGWIGIGNQALSVIEEQRVAEAFKDLHKGGTVVKLFLYPTLLDNAT
jgi:M6 family metalloprotease-like protein